MREKPEVGQIFYSLNIGNAARHRKQELTPVVVTKVGKKYFTCCPEGGKKFQEEQFFIENWRQKTDYSPNAQLYQSREEYEEERERNLIVQYLAEVFTNRNRFSLSLVQLREIERVIRSKE